MLLVLTTFLSCHRVKDYMKQHSNHLCSIFWDKVQGKDSYAALYIISTLLQGFLKGHSMPSKEKIAMYSLSRNSHSEKKESDSMYNCVRCLIT